MVFAGISLAVSVKKASKITHVEKSLLRTADFSLSLIMGRQVSLFPRWEIRSMLGDTRLQ